MVYSVLMLKRIAALPAQSFFLFGPRGSGKTTWIRQALPGATLLDLRDERLFRQLASLPGHLGDRLRAVPTGSWVIIDEVQRLPEVLHEVHRAIDERGLSFALTGSSARKLRRAGVNLLGGRALRRAMFPFVPEEYAGAFDLDAALRHGTLPIVHAAPDKDEALQAYVDVYLREEVQSEALVRNLPAFARFLPIAALFHGQTLNLASLARDAMVARATVEDYLTILEDTHLAFRVPSFGARLRVRERVHPKLYWIDPGVVRALRGHQGALRSEERGPLLEGFVAMVLRAYAEHRKAFQSLSTWAPREGRLEVDFLATRGEEHVAIEVKASTRFRTEELGGLEAIGALAGVRRRLYVYLGAERLRHASGIEAVPLGEFLRELEGGALFPGAPG